jgi:hypothetical protein
MICGPICEQNVWRIRTNREISEIFGQETITNVIKAGRLRWAGHVTRMNDERIVKRIFTRRVEGTRAKGRPRKRWIDCVEEDSRKLGVSNWRTCAENRQQWVAVVESAKTRLG